jgi:peptidoglycan lytic transglycosylase
MRRGVVGSGFLLVVLVAGCAVRRPVEIGKVEPPTPPVQTGIASWYGPGFHGEATSSGEVYDQRQLTAAHRTLPLGTRVEVTNLDNGRTIEVRVNDRGPFVGDRIIDLSYAAAQALEMIGPGTAPVQIQILGEAAGSFPAVSYAVQAGSFADQENARRLQRALAREVQGVYVTELEKDGRSYYRVRIGPYRRREDAVQVARRITPLGISGLIMEEAAVAGQ